MSITLKNKDLLPFWVGFSCLRHIGPKRFQKIFSFFRGDLEKAWSAPVSEYISCGFEPKLASQICNDQRQIDLGKKMEELKKNNIEAVIITDPRYPKLLKQIYDPPFVLYVRGKIEIFSKPCLAVVGTRKHSVYGKKVLEHLVSQLASLDWIIVSGLALGIDSLAHQVALENGSTIAVIPSGLDDNCICPSRNLGLAHRIMQNGALVSEHPPGKPPERYTFVIRNRIISGLCLGSLIIEAPEQSGALLTASASLEQNREVFSVPGDIFSETSLGTNKLIQQGAKMVTSISDILDVFNLGI
ncbi:MAG: DNA-processing protein DprA [Patescibacteria group bacterium]